MCIDPTYPNISILIIWIVIGVLNVIIISFRKIWPGFWKRISKINGKLQKFIGFDGISSQILIFGLYYIWLFRDKTKDPIITAILFFTAIAIVQYTRETFNLRVVTKSSLEHEEKNN